MTKLILKTAEVEEVLFISFRSLIDSPLELIIDGMIDFSFLCYSWFADLLNSLFCCYIEKFSYLL